MIQFHALGGLTITDDGREVSLGGSRQRRLVAVLLIHRNAVVSVDRIADAVFAGAPTDAASTTLRSYVARIRRVVDAVGSAATVVTQAPGYMLRLPGEAFDVACFEQMIADAGSRLARGDATGASSGLREALALWGGDAYAEFADEDWARPEAQRLEELRIVAHERLVEAELACGRAAELIPEIESLAREHELREGFRSQLMIALYRAGRQADALRVFREYRHVLVEELGLEPSPAMVELERRILGHDAELMVTEPAELPLRGYRLGERLGTGRDGTVFAARVPGVQRDFAIRVIREEIVDRPEFVRSFEATAHRLASLRHPAIVTIHDYWREPGAAYLVMRRMPGGTLRDRLNRGPLSHAAVVTLVRRIGGALIAAADVGIAHGRVCPESVVFDEAGEPCLADFSLGQTAHLDDASKPSNSDVSDLATMCGECLADASGPIGDVLAIGVSTVGRPSIREFVVALIDVVAREASGPVLVRPNPYKGLQAFDEADAADFFGRDGLIDEILARLAGGELRSRLVLVVGASGSGKSSVVRAGLLPRVRRGEVPGSEHWFVTTMLPGSSPFKELAESVRRIAVSDSAGLVDDLAGGDEGIDSVVRRIVPDGGQLLLVIDQFEELFTLSSERDQRAFLDGLIHAVSVADSRLRVVATLRADFYDRPLAFQRFGAAVNEVTVTVAAMSPAELESAVVEPARRVGAEVEGSLAAELVAGVVDQPAALPSLQFALYELAERSADRSLTLAAYRKLGGVDGVIASRAESLYLSLEDPERTAARQMFERLVVVAGEGEPTRRRVARTELSRIVSEPAVDALVDEWAQARLITLDRHPQTRVPTVELAHEALLREWPRLRDWIDEDRAAIVALGLLRDAASSWVDLGRDPGALLRGARLEVALDATTARPGDLPEQEREFLDASRQARDSGIARQAKANRRLRIQLAAIAAALVVALVGGFVAVDQRREAQQERRVATVRELASASVGSLAEDPERSMLLALAAIGETRSSDGTALPEAEQALHWAVTASRIVSRFPGVGGAVDWSADGTIFVNEGPEDSGLLDIRSAVTGASVLSFRGHDVDVNDVAFSDDGSMVATAGDDGAVRVWDPTSGDQLAEFPFEGEGASAGLSFAGDGSRLAATWFDAGVVRVFDLRTSELVVEIVSNAPVALSADGERLAMGGSTASVRDAASGEVLYTLDSGWVNSLDWSADGRWLATGDGAGIVGLWDGDTGEHLSTVGGHTGIVINLDWSPDGTRLATAGDDGTVRVWEVVAGQLRESLVLSGQEIGRADVAFSPDGDRLMTGNEAITLVTVWDVSATGGAEWANLSENWSSGVSFLPDSRRVAVSSDLGGVTVWDVETEDRLRLPGPIRSVGEVEAVDISPDGQLIATSGGKFVDVHELSSGNHLFSAGDEDASVDDWAWSNDSQLLAVAQVDVAGVVVVDRAGAELARLRPEPGFDFVSVSFSPDGRLIATTNADIDRFVPTTATVTIWDWRRGEIVRTIETPSLDAVFDPTGTRLVTSYWVTAGAEIWDPRTGKLIAVLTAPSVVTNVTFDHDGTRVATGHEDGTVRLWDAASGTQIFELRGHESPVTAVEFSPDGTKLASVDDAGIYRVWALDLDDLIAIANERLTRGFSDDECRKYLHLERCPQA